MLAGSIALVKGSDCGAPLEHTGVFPRKRPCGRRAGRSNYGVSIALRIPSKAYLRSEVAIGLVHCVPQAGIELIIELVQGRDRAKITVGPSGVAHVTKTER